MCLCVRGCGSVVAVQSDWEGVIIPAVLISKSQGERLLSFLDLVTCELDEHGRQVYVRDR